MMLYEDFRVKSTNLYTYSRKQTRSHFHIHLLLPLEQCVKWGLTQEKNLFIRSKALVFSLTERPGHFTNTVIPDTARVSAETNFIFFNKIRLA